MISVHELRKLIEGKADDEQIPLYVRYNEVENDSVFLRTDSLIADVPAGEPQEYAPGLWLTVSLVSGEECDSPFHRDVPGQ